MKNDQRDVPSIWSKAFQEQVARKSRERQEYLDVGYAANGNLLAHSDTVMGDWAFQYDTLNRLAAMAPAGNAPANYVNLIGCYGYDAFGNRTLAGLTSSDCTGSNTPTASYNANNQVISNNYAYDAAGNVYSDGNNTYAYDGEGRLCAVETYSPSAQYQYIYDAEGLRVAKATFTGAFPAKNYTCAAPGAATGYTLTAQYLLDAGGDQVTELNGTGGWVHSNAWAGAHLNATYDTMGLHFHLSDPLGTRRVQTNVNGVAEANFQSLPYGDGFLYTSTGLSTSDDATEHHFTSKEHDAESGNDYFQARYYASSIGRFMSPDWSAKVEPVPYSKMDDPQSLNLYAYVGNNPLVRIDRDGHYVCEGSARQCGDLKDALARIADAAKSNRLTKDEKAFLKKIVDFYGSDEGKATKDTKVLVGFTKDSGNTKLNDGVVKVTLNFNEADKAASKPGTSQDAERAAHAAHEGDHGRNKLLHGNPINRSEEKEREVGGYTAQATVNKGLGVDSGYGLWTNAGGMNAGNIDAFAEKSTNQWCENVGGCN